MSNGLDSFLTRIGDVTIERVNPRGNAPRSAVDPPVVPPQPEVQLSAIGDGRAIDYTSDESSIEASDGEMPPEAMKNSEGSREIRDDSADDMDLDETVHSHIGVRSEARPEDEEDDEEEEVNEEDEENDIEAVDILENLPLEGAPIEGQEVSEADLLGKAISKDLEDAESEDNEASKTDGNSTSEDGTESGKRPLDADNAESSSKKQKVDESGEETGSECETKQMDKKTANMRRNIREVMDETQLDEATLAAQRQEMERLRRVQEQQRIIREVQRQFAVNRQNNKGQQRAVSLLQGKQSLPGTTISPSVQVTAQPSSSSVAEAASQARMPSTVLMKVNSGSGSGSTTQIYPSAAQASSVQMPSRPLQDSRYHRGRPPAFQTAQTSISRVPANRSSVNSNMLQQRIRMMTPSVSISPVVPKKEPHRRRVDFFSDSELSDMDAEEELHEKQMQAARKMTTGTKPPKSPKGKELVTISSSSESSDDDCIVLSDPSADEESDNEDDPSNSGMHTNDRYNVPDEHGRVLVNVGHPDSEPDVFLAPQVARIIKPHQIGGIRFLYDNIIESIERYKTSSGFGCILAHSMGLGKTLQVASFCDIFFRCTSAKTVLCIMPINTLQNWLAEFNMWLPYEDPNAVKREPVINVKQEPGLDIKSEIKEESSSNLSCPSNPPPTDGAPKDPFSNNQNFDNRPVGGFENAPGTYNTTPQNPMYNTNFNPQMVPQAPYNAGFPSASQPPVYPDYVDSQQMSMYPPNYDNSRFMNYPGSEKREVAMKKEPEDSKPESKEETEKPEVKDNKSKTPYSVDAPSELESRPRHFHLHILNDSHKSMAARARVIKSWQKDGGVLMIGYELYRQLSLKKPTKSKRKRGQPIKEAVDVEEEDKNKGLLDEMHVALVNPGPDLVICDEGHRIKNSHASISLALKQMRTKRRIVLTGYPLQNNLLEYWCMVDFVRPSYLGTKSEFCNMFERPIQNGQCIDSTPQDIRLMRYRAHVLHDLLEGFVQRRSHSVLQVSLPRKEEYIMLVRMTSFQRKLYDTFMNQVVKTRAVPNPLKAFAVCCKIWNHPDILYHFLRKRQANEEDDLDLEETIGEKPAPGAKKSKARQPKGESKKGKKGEKAKNKPAASVQPNSSGSTVLNAPGVAEAAPETNMTDSTANTTINNNSSNSNSNGSNGSGNKPQNIGANVAKPFPNNYPVAMQNSPGYANAPTVGGQQGYTVPPTQDYPNYRSNDQGNYYPEGNQEYNEFYNNNSNQSFQQYPPNSNYNSGQIYSNQQTNYLAGTEQRVPGGNHHQTSTQNYDQTGVFPRQQGYNQYQDRTGRNFNSNINQGQNYSQQPANFQSQMPIQDYQHGNTYPNQQSSFSQSSGQQSQSLGFTSTGNNSPANPSIPQANVGQNTSYLNNQRMQSGTAVSQGFAGTQTTQSQHGFPANQQGQTVPIQNYPANQSSTATSGGFGQSGQQGTRQQSSHGYIQGTQTTMPQNQIRNYTGSQGMSQAHGYGTQDQNQGNAGTMHGYASNQQSQVYKGAGQSQGANYPASQSNSVTGPGQNRYPAGTNPQQPATPLQQNQTIYPSTQQVQNPTPINQSDRMFGCTDQATSNQSYTQAPNTTPVANNYPANSTQNQPNLPDFPATDTNHSSQSTPFKNQDEQYWQRSYQQPYTGSDQKYNETYFRGDAGATNRYQGNYYQQQNYQNSSFDYTMTAPPHDGSATKLTEDVKASPSRPAGLPMASPGSKEATSVPITKQQQTPMGGNFAPPDGAQRSQTVPLVKGLPMQKSGENQGKEEEEKEGFEKEKEEKSDEEMIVKEEEKDLKSSPICKEDPGIPYDWATELMKGYVPGLIDASAKMTLFFCILEEAIRLGDRVLAFSQSLFTLNLIEDFLARNDLKYPDDKTEAWVKNVNYYRLDGSTSALEREKLINEFNANPKIHLFLVSTRAGSLGINLVGANRAIVFDASWNPCHDTQAVCRVYRYGQQKKCYVYRLVTDNCLERKIYDRQISKQGMADRVVDQCNPDAHLSLKEATTLSWDWEEDSQVQDFSQSKDNYADPVMHKVLKQHSSLLTKQPFHHESLLVDRKDKKLSQAEKRLARRGYELEKMAANCSRPSYNYVPGNTATRGGLQIRAIRGGGAPTDVGPAPKPVASVRPMQQRGAEGLGARGMAGSRWIPAEVWQRQGMSAQEMTLPLDVVIPTNSPDKGSIVLKAGQRVMVLKSPKGIYMQLESGKIIAIRTALKLNQQKRDEEARAELPKKGHVVPKSAPPSVDLTQDTPDLSQPEPHLTPTFFSSPGVSSSPSPRSSKQQQPQQPPQDVGFPLRNNSAISIIPKSSTSGAPQRPLPRSNSGPSYRPFEKEATRRQRPIATAAAKPYSSHFNLTNQVSLSRLPRTVKQEPSEQASPSGGENSNSSDGQPMRTEQRVEEVRLEDVVAEVAPHSDYDARHVRRHDANAPTRAYATLPESAQVTTPAPSVDVAAEKQRPEMLFGQKSKEDAMVEDVIIDDQSQVAPAVPPSRPGEAKSADVAALPVDTQKNISGDSAANVEGYHEGHMLQGYPYGQYPRYYDYGDPRSRSLSNPYGSYYPGVPPPPTSTSRTAADPTKAPSVQSEVPKLPEDVSSVSTGEPTVYQQNVEPVPVVAAAKSQEPQQEDSKVPADDAVGAAVPNAATRDDLSNANVPGAYGHPSGGHYPGPYPPGPYDPYAQHYPHTPASSAGYPPTGAPGYPAYGGPTYNADYARMYSAFHGPPPPAADPYIHHRGYAPPSSHPPNYYPPFPPPPPPYPNYSFLPPYPNPNVPAEPQPPAQ